MAEKTCFLVHHKIRLPISTLTDEERGQLFMAVLDYSEYGVVPDLTGATAMAFEFIRVDMDADRESWEATCVARSRSGSMGGRPRKNSAQQKANAFSEKQTKAKKANAFSEKQKKQMKAKKADYDSDCEYEYDSDTDIEYDDDSDYELERVGERESEREGGTSAAKPPRSFRFIPPTVEQVREYCEQRHNDVDPQQFVDFYESKGWMVGKNKMKSWQSSVRTWEGRRKKDPVPERRDASFADLLKEMEDEERGETA